MLHKSLNTISIKEWNNISSYDNINFKPLFKKPIFSIFSRFMKKKLINSYMKLIYDFENIDIDLLSDYVLWQTYYTEFKIDFENKKLDINLRTDTKIKYQNLEEAFKKYIRKYQEKNYNFKIKEYYFREDYEIKFKELFKVEINSESSLKKIHEFKDIKFYTKDEYVIFCDKYPEISLIIKLDLFYDEFIKERIINLTKIEELDDYLLDIYINNNLYDRYQFIRAALFDMHNIKSDSGKKMSTIDEMTNINNYLGCNMSINDTMAVLESNKEIAIRKIETQKDNNGGAKI